MLNIELSEKEQEFSHQLGIYFPQFHDIKYLINDIENIKNMGLGNLAYEIKVNFKYYLIKGLKNWALTLSRWRCTHHFNGFL